ncbi:MAG: uroporphyrin-III C-methyltransferase [Solirubrobacterales bacterium]|nr:uroporphyrin-III C-methyltransferase [Solirubrobacterales bacterium]
MAVPESEPGRVYLVGAGPGDPGLLTARALQLIASADVILYDRLIPAAALDGAREDALQLFVGKEGRGPSVPQEETEALLIGHARAGRTVVRLKGGDPFVFGRGGEEALAMRAAGIPFEVVPGITAGIAGAAYAGIPVTHRGISSAVALVTGHEDPEKDETAIDWAALAAFPGTLVFYMGVGRLAQIAEALIDAGRDASQPAAVVENGTLPGQRAVGGTLETIAEVARASEIRPPSITVVGPVAALAAELSWLPPRPLRGRTVAVTRARAQSSELARRLEAQGASVVQAPVIRVRALPGPPLDPSPYDLVCVTSANGVAPLFERLEAGGRDARSLSGARVAAIGPGTARALAERGIAADVVPDRFVAEALVEALAEVPVARALVARAREGRDVLPDALRARGAEVDVLALYETVPEALSPSALQTALNADYITFTSSSTVRYFLDAVAAGGQGTSDASGAGPGRPPWSAGTRVVSIGPVTSETLRAHGLEADVEAERHDIDGVLDALLADAASGASEPAVS